MKMPFGKYKGEEVSVVPINYLEWLLDNATIKNPMLRREALQRCNRPVTSDLQLKVEELEQGIQDLGKIILDYKRQCEEYRQEIKVLKASEGLVTDDINRMFRQLAIKYHPDKGGTHESMVAITEFKDLLIELLT